MKAGTPVAPGIRLREFVGALTALGALLLPLKFGSLAVMPESSSLFPGDLFSWIIISWPAHFFGVFSAFLLLAALAVFPLPKFRSGAAVCALLWGVLLPLATLPGWIHAAGIDYPWGQSAHFAGVGCFVLAVFLVSGGEPKFRGWILNGFAAGMLLLGIDAMHQYFFGFAVMREYLQRQIEAGVQVSFPLKLRIYDTRVYSTFVSCNTLAGFLLLAGPVAALIFTRWGERFEPVRVSRILFGALGGGMLLAAFLLTRSRGGYLCALLAGAGAFFSLPFRRRWKALVAAGAAAVLIVGSVYIHSSGRGFLSMSERVDYLHSSATMCLEKPLTGFGWGGFFTWHMRNKHTDSDESARDPHNLVAAFASQAGIPAGLVAFAVLFWPLLELGKRRRKTLLNGVVFWSYGAFSLHTLMEINSQIPATLAAAGMLAVLLTLPETPETEKRSTFRIPAVVVALLLATGAACGNLLWLRAEYRLEQLHRLLAPPAPVAGTENVPAASAPAPELVLERMRCAAAARPDSAVPYEMAGDWFIAGGDDATARICFEKALSVDSSRPGLFRRMAELAARRGEMERARKWMSRAHELFPANPKYRLESIVPVKK